MFFEMQLENNMSHITHKHSTYAYAIYLQYPPGNGYISHQKAQGKSLTQTYLARGDMLVARRVVFSHGKNLSFS